MPTLFVSHLLSSFKQKLIVFAVVLPLQNWLYGIILAQFLKYSLILSLKSVGTSVIEIARVNPVLNQVVLEKVDCRCSVGTDS